MNLTRFTGSGHESWTLVRLQIYDIGVHARFVKVKTYSCQDSLSFPNWKSSRSRHGESYVVIGLQVQKRSESLIVLCYSCGSKPVSIYIYIYIYILGVYIQPRNQFEFMERTVHESIQLFCYIFGINSPQNTSLQATNTTWSRARIWVHQHAPQDYARS